MSRSTANFEHLFHASALDLVIPEHSSLAAYPDVPSWWSQCRAGSSSRHVSFLDEKLLYLLCMTIPYDALSASGSSSAAQEPPSELLRFLSRLQLTANASFVPPLATQALPSSDGPTSGLLPPETPHMPTTPANGLPPVTPNPFPQMDEREGQYASVDGVTIWEGEVAELDDDDQSDRDAGGHLEEVQKGGGEKGRWVLRGDNGWWVIWAGHVPVAYVRTNIHNPLLSITTSVTLRDTPQKTRKGVSETASVISAETTQTDATDEPDLNEEEDDLAGMEEIDLLGGLGGGETMPTTRLAPSIRQDLSLPPPSARAPMTAVTPATSLTVSTVPSASSTAGPSRERSDPHHGLAESNGTLRKSYRRVLSLSSGLRVRMRTLFLPQLLPPQSASEAAHDHNEDEAEKRIVMSVEVENPLEPDIAHSFEIRSITVDIGGKGAPATTSLASQARPSEDVFPLRLKAVEQYNLLYTVSIASAPEDRQGLDDVLAKTIGRGDEQRPVAITVVGRPYTGTEGHSRYPAKEFSSRWNCNLDLAPYYASLPATASPTAPTGKARDSKVVNAIAGDKRYSLASLLSQNEKGQQRLVSNRQTLPPAPHGRVHSYRGPMPGGGHGLLLSVKILNHEEGVRPLQPFSLEVFVHNRTDEVKRFRVSVPGREDWNERLRDVWAKRRRRKDEDDGGIDDPVLRQFLHAHTASATPLVPLEDDLRCGPLLPGASMAARMRFVALRQGVHPLERLRITGANEEFDFIMSPVLDIVVGEGNAQTL